MDNRMIKVKIPVESFYIHRVTGKPIKRTWFNRVFRGKNIVERPSRKYVERYIPTFGIIE